MDALVRSYAAVDDGDLMLCPEHGVAYQRDMAAGRVEYDADYWRRLLDYEGTPIERALNAGRVALVDEYAGPGALVCDVGIGGGTFIRARRGPTWGTDVNPVALAWLRERGLWATELAAFDALTFWDVLEHVEDPGTYLDQVRPGALVFASLPVFADLTRIRASRHYRPGEHLYYWTEPGFVAWMAGRRFRCFDRRDFETAAGRDSIRTFAFRKGLA